MPAEGLCLRVTHTGLAAVSLPLNDINDGVGRDTGDDRFRRSGPAYVPEGASIELVYTSDVAKSYEVGTIRGYITGGHLTAEFLVSTALGTAIGDALAFPGQVQGSILYFNGTDWVTLPPGASGQVLRTLGPAANPVWATPGSGTTKDPVRLATTQDIQTNTSTAGVPVYTDTGGSSGRGQITATLAVGDVFTVDGVSLGAAQNGTRVLIKDESGALGADANGVYTTTISGTSLTLDRAGDFDQDAEVMSALTVFAEEGTTNLDSQWILTTNNPITIGGATGTSLTFSASINVPGGNQIETDTIAEATPDNGVLINGTRHYPDSAADPAVGPAAADGDRYYNTVLDMEMRYDGTRAKWLSVNEAWMEFGRSGTTAANSFFEGPGDVRFRPTRGFPAQFGGTVVALSFTRSDTDATTVEVTRDGTLIAGAVLASSAIYNATTTLNADFASGGVLGVRNQVGGNDINNVSGWVRLKWRA